MKQVRAELRKQARIKRHEKAVELQMALEDRTAARRLLEELAELARGSRRWSARFKVQDPPKAPATRTSQVRKRPTLSPIKATRTPPAGTRPASSWAVDGFGMRGIIWQQSYLGRKSSNFYRGAARDNWEYIVRDEAVLLDSAGEPIIVANMGDDWVEIGAAWQVMEDGSARKNAKVQILTIAPFDSDMSQEEMVAALRHFCSTVLEPLGLPYSAAIHAPPEHGDERNFHPHIAFSLRPMRRVAPYCWDVADEICGELDGRDGVQTLRHLWAHSMSEAAAQAKRAMAYTGLGYGVRGLGLEVGTHLGEGLSAIAARGGHVWAHERNRIKNERNAARRRMRDLDHKIAALTKVRDAAIARQAVERSATPTRRFAASDPTRAVPERTAQSPVEPTINVVSEPVTQARRVAASRAPAAQRRETENAPGAVPMKREASKGVARHHAITPSSVPDHVGPSVGRAASMTIRQAKPAMTSAEQPVAVAPPLRRAPAVATETAARPIARPVHGYVPLPVTARVAAEPDGMMRRPAMSAAPVIARKRTSTSVDAASTSSDPIVALAHAMLTAIGLDRLRKQARKRSPADRGDQLQDNEAEKDSLQSEPQIAEDSPLQPVATPVTGRPATTAVPRDSRSRSPVARAARWRSTRVAANVSHDPPMATWPSRTWHEQHPQEPWTAQAASAEALDRRRLTHLHNIDAYVADLRDGGFDIGPAATKALGVAEDWVRRLDIQQALAEMRQGQQKVMQLLAADAERRPLVFARTGTRFWPRDFPPTQLARLDRWASDPGFQNDVFEIERTVRAAHLAADAKTVTRRPGPVAPGTTERRGTPVPDGFGGVSDTPAPVFAYREVGPRVRAFEPSTGKPTRSLLELLRFCGEHPRALAFASDGKLIGLPGTPPLIDPLIRMWRYNDQVEALVTATVAASRKAGRAVYPAEHAAAIRALSSRESVSNPPPDHNRGIGR